jgi:hypothetical protein
MLKVTEEMRQEILESHNAKLRRPNNEMLQMKNYYMWDWKKRMWDVMMTAGLIDFDGSADVDSMIGPE